MFKVKVNWGDHQSDIFECVSPQVNGEWIKLYKKHPFGVTDSYDIEYESVEKAREVYNEIINHINNIENFKIFAIADNSGALDFVYEMPDE